MLPAERALIALLLSADFPGRELLARQFDGLKVVSIDQNGSLALRPSIGSPAPVVRRIPVEAEYRDSDGVTVHVLLHVVRGWLHEFEVYREDSQLVRCSASEAGEIELIVL